jgi:UDP-N-acetylmuramoyl-L-alanyl-D-glutamate--2,6-diaminopimelate ligase
MITARLSDILSPFTAIPDGFDCNISGLESDSRFIKAGDLFFACQGMHQDGRQFIDDAIKKGAVAVITAATNSDEAPYRHGSIPVFPLQDLNPKIGLIAAAFYQYPAASLRIIGITGTNGKTSCSHFLAASLQRLGITCGVIGTLGNGLYDDIQPSNWTTPDAVTLQKTFADLVKKGARAVAMEVSSHGIDLGRVSGVPFEVGIFTNLTRDHLDYHGDMQTYGAVKKRLFDSPLLRQAVINNDDEFGKTIIADVARHKPVFAYGRAGQSSAAAPHITVENVQMGKRGLQAFVRTPWGSGDLQTALIGEFNISNVLAVLTTLCVMEIPFAQALASVNELTPVPGRLQTVGGGDLPLIAVDYAHTPDALEKVLVALRQHCQGRLLCVFGCGGDRDNGKRPMMARIAEQYADFVLVTDDNPRHESPAQIVGDIMQGFAHPQAVIVQHDRSKAIEYIIQCANAGDCVLIAGKGAERFQQIGDVKTPFCDIEKVNQILLNSVQ